MVVRHEGVEREGRTLHSVYGHVAPAVRVGATLAAAALVGKVGANTKTSAPPHLHLSAAWLPPGTPPPESWDELNDGRALLGCPAAVPAERVRAAATSEEELARAAPPPAALNAQGAFAEQLGGGDGGGGGGGGEAAGKKTWRGSPAQMLRART